MDLEMAAVGAKSAALSGATNVASDGGATRPQGIPGTLAPSALLTLRAAAAVGDEFVVAHVAALLELAPARVLEQLQIAADAGLPLEDRGDGRLVLPAPVAGWLRATTLPSLLASWQGRRDRAVGERGATPTPLPRAAASESQRAPRTAGSDAAPATVDDAAPRSGAPRSVPGDDPPVRKSAPRIGHAHPSAPLGPPPRSEYAESFHGSAIRADRAPAADARVEAPASSPAGSASQAPDAAAARLLSAAQAAAAQGRVSEALKHGREALAQMAKLPLTDERRRLGIRVLCDLGRMQWESSGPGPNFTLAGALETVQAAWTLLRDEDPTLLRATVASILAGICCDLGDLPALEAALEALTTATRALVDAGDARGAARLLNDQAGVYLRLGDPVRAAYLLEHSRSLFEERAASEPDERLERADTEHLLGRLPLHAAARPGREADALAMARRHCASAAASYRALGDERKLAHVHETLARLALGAGELPVAEEHLAAAVQTQESLGDVLGLARSTAALAEIRAAAGSYDDALRLLADSVSLNLEKGSPLGLAFNRRSLNKLAARASGQDPDAANAVAQQLMAAEKILGSTVVPGSA